MSGFRATPPLAELLSQGGFKADFWRSRDPRPAEDLPIYELTQLSTAVAREATPGRIPKDRRYFFPYRADPEARGGPHSKWELDAGSDGRIKNQAERNAVAFSGLTVIDAIVDKVLKVSTIEPDERELKIISILEASPNPALVFVLTVIADNLALNDWRVDAIPAVYEYALEMAQRPNVHNELGVILLERAGIEVDIGEAGVVVISARDFGGSEILSWDQVDGPMMPEHSTRLVQLAGDAFARAYGYYETDWAGEFADVVANRPDLDVWYQACSALDGLRVFAEEQGRPDLQRAVWIESYLLSDWGPKGPRTGDLTWGTEFAHRFAYSLGLATGLEQADEQQDAVRAASQLLAPPVGLVEQIRRAVGEELRSASTEQLREAESAAATLTGPAWVDLPTAVRDDLTQAEYMQGISYHSSFNWAPVVLLFCHAVERLLGERFGTELERYLLEQQVAPEAFLSERGVKLKHGLSKGMIGEFAFLIRKCLPDPLMTDFMARTPLKHIGRLREIGGRIDGINQKYRRVTAHPRDAISGAAVRDLKRSLYESTNGPAESLMSLLSSLRMQS